MSLAPREWPLVSAAEMRALDRHTIETLGVPGAILMENAGRAVAEMALALGAAETGVFVVCGAGNNGGDGLVAARLLHLAGVPLRVSLLGAPEALHGDAAANWALARNAGVPFASEIAPPRGALVVDAIFGTGLARTVTGEAAAAVERLRAARPACRVLSVDLPSGLDADTGQALGPAVQADVTVTLGLPKRGLALEPGRSLAGRIFVARIGIADAAPGVRPDVSLWTRRAAARRLPPRPRAGHKGTFGHVLVIAGSDGKIGAAVLAAQGAARAGAGLVTVACPIGLRDVFEEKCTEAMTAPVSEAPGRAFVLGAGPALAALAAGRDAVVLGPGLGTADETAALVRALVAQVERPMVIDADALHALAACPDVLKARSAASILTPHPGEAGRLLGLSPADVNRDRVAAATRLAARSGCVVVLKGAATVVAEPGPCAAPGGPEGAAGTGQGRVTVIATGGPVLGTGGTGDVLAGALAGLLAQGAPAFEAAALGAYLHGLAGDRWAARHGDTGALAGEIAREIPAAIAELRSARGARNGQGEEGETGDGGGRVGGLTLSFPEP